MAKEEIKEAATKQAEPQVNNAPKSTVEEIKLKHGEVIACPANHKADEDCIITTLSDFNRVYAKQGWTMKEEKKS